MQQSVKGLSYCIFKGALKFSNIWDRWIEKWFTSFQPVVAFYSETSHLICCFLHEMQQWTEMGLKASR